MAKQVEYPADTVDSSGKVWDTVGENIRKGKKELDYDDFENKMKIFFNDMYPVGSQYIGQLPLIFTKWFKWKIGIDGEHPANPVFMRVSGTENQPVSYTTDWSIPMLNSSDRVKFSEQLGIHVDVGVYAIPIWTRVA